MAWNTGFWFLAQGASIRINFWWGYYAGLQFAVARPWTASTLNRYEVTTVDRGLSYQLVPSGDSFTDEWIYHVDVRNTGPGITYFTLTGGEVT